MLVSTYQLNDTERTNARRQWVDARPFTIGRAADCDVVLEDPEVAAHHLRVSVQGSDILVENLSASTEVDGTAVAANTTVLVTEGRPIRIGGTILKVRMQASPVVTTGPSRPSTPLPTRPNSPTVPYPRPQEPPVMRNPPPPTNPVYAMPSNPPHPQVKMPRPRVKPRARKEKLSQDPTEQAFIATLRAQPADIAVRMVYADWLEQNGKRAQCELLKLTEHLDTFMHKNASDIDWRVVCARTPIDNCIQNRCPGFWDGLNPVDGNDYVRSCRECNKHVAYCGNLQEVRAAAWDESPVVFDAALDRVAAHAAYRRFDVDPPAITMDEEEDLDDDPEGYTLDTPPSNYRR